MDAEAFILRWTGREGGAERANYQGFLYELCDLIGVPRPEVSGADAARNSYAFERAVRPRESAFGQAPKRIDLYKRGCFILEAKQSRLPGRKNALPGADIAQQPEGFGDEPETLGRRSASRGWDVMMLNALRQAEAYVFLLEPDHPAPPFLIVCDVGHCIEIFADFSGTGRAYGPFPDRQGFRVYLQDLRDADVRGRLAAIWTDPLSLDPSRKAARVTREIARRLAAVSRSLEAQHDGRAEDIALFLMRSIFTMFASDVDLLPRGRFTQLLADCVSSPAAFAPLLDELWSKMDEKEHDRRFFSAFRTHVRHFNGNLFRGAKAYRLGAEEIGELLAASRMDWREVDPAIFGALLEQALAPAERKRLGAHYTPRAHVRRLVDVTVMEPLREDWRMALTRAEQAKDEGKDKIARDMVRAFHRRLCATRVLDPACGTGNFLYVALELMKTLEGEVLETLARLGEHESMGLDRETVDPHQFLGLELNPRAAAIAELVVWIGYLQQHYRTRTGHPGEPILRTFRNINFGRREGYNAVLTWDGYPTPAIVERRGERAEIYPNARQPDWPEADFIIGNPPFVSASAMKSELGGPYVDALRAAYPEINASADFVMYWWDRAASLVTAPDARTRRSGLVATNSISQPLLRRVVEKRLNGRPRASVVFAIPDQPWTRPSGVAAAVRIAMTVIEAGEAEGRLLRLRTESGLGTDEPTLTFETTRGRINADLTVGVDVTGARALKAAAGVGHDGVKLHGAGFLIRQDQFASIGIGRRAGLESFVRPYANGRDLMHRSRGLFALDFLGLDEGDVRARFPEAYQHLLDKVRFDLDERGTPRTDAKGRKTGREWNNRAVYRNSWWLFGEPRRELRPALEGLPRFIATVDTARHRVFQFVPSEMLLDDKSVIVASQDAAILAVLSSRIHVAWAMRAGGRLGVGNDPVYSKSRCFDPFPFPEPRAETRRALREAGEELDALRKRVQAENPDITLTGLYNVVERIRLGAPLLDKEEDVKRSGLAMIVKELHAAIDRLTCEAYGWSADVGDDVVLSRLVALNAARVEEEAAGRVRWLRPDYQSPLFEVPRSFEGLVTGPDENAPVVVGLPAFPADPYEQPLAVEATLAAAGRPLSADEIARAFRGAAKARGRRVSDVLGTLTRYGRISALADGRFASRRVA